MKPRPTPESSSSGHEYGQEARRTMKEQSILIADKDTRYLQELAEYLAGAGYQVETTNSATHVICDILKKQAPVLLLGSDFDKNIDLPQLIALLKKCNRHLAVIMVSDEATLPRVRRIRREGIFYHALRPIAPSDREEIRQAVECAFKSL
jgi:DNA-binding NtrC family response regulator